MLIDTRSLTQDIKSFGMKLGFSHVGIASPDHSVWADRFRNWIKQGFHGEMGYMERSSERRIDPFAVFPEVKFMLMQARYLKRPMLLWQALDGWGKTRLSLILKQVHGSYSVFYSLI